MTMTDEEKRKQKAAKEKARLKRVRLNRKARLMAETDQEREERKRYEAMMRKMRRDGQA
jgi:hypothetical protein